MARETRLCVGTRKGAFQMCSHDGRRTWQMHDPILAGWSVYHFVEDGRDPARQYAAANHDVWGPWLARSVDGGRSWQERTESPAFSGDDGRAVKALWYVQPGHAERPGEVWAGADPGALFRSADWGATWQPVASLTDHPTRDGWMPGGGGLCLHGISIHPHDPDRMLATISAAGVFRTEDGGGSWQPSNTGVRADFLPDPSVPVGSCVHCVVRSPADPNWLFQQNHCGMYRSADGGLTWEEVGQGQLPSEFGFPAAIHPHEPHTVYVAPLVGDSFRVFPDGGVTVWRSRDGGDNWEPLRSGLPQRGAYLSALRRAMTADREDDAGIYLGTSTGQIFFSPDAGEHWQMIADYLPPILSVEVAST